MCVCARVKETHTSHMSNGKRNYRISADGQNELFRCRAHTRLRRFQFELVDIYILGVQHNFFIFNSIFI